MHRDLGTGTRSKHKNNGQVYNRTLSIDTAQHGKSHEVSKYILVRNIFDEHFVFRECSHLGAADGRILNEQESSHKQAFVLLTFGG